jgi:hypothetical protein
MLCPSPSDGKPALSSTLCQPTRRTCVGLGPRRIGSGAEAPATGIPAAAGPENVPPGRGAFEGRDLASGGPADTANKNEGLPVGIPEAGRKARAREFLRQRARTIWLPVKKIYVSVVYEAVATRNTLRV